MISFFRDKKGFTLIEMLVTLTIVSVLAASAIPLAKIAVKRQKEIELRRNLRIIREAIDEYKILSDENKIEVKEDSYGYPPDLESLVIGVEIKSEDEASEEPQKVKKFLRRIPKDPMTKSGEWGLRSYQDDYDSDKWGGENVYDIYSKSTETAIDGSKYRNW
ncbi:MAG: type II secretion system protein [Candidatus Aminicenantes bacterium]|nr:type II secretion system protein [Candidatus Aminicenantes bacterium]